MFFGDMVETIEGTAVDVLFGVSSRDWFLLRALGSLGSP
jgi:hypothetical protein